ncbi:MAG: RNA polymerase sigma factor [Planctomycetaceae bacterium]|nr:RNA polymerase sigma factor [Planctomycetaceae bacterium]
MDHDPEIRPIVERSCVEFERDLKSFLLGVLRDVHVAEDAYQRTVIKALAAAETVDPEKIRGWLFRIALNEAREIKRGDARREKLKRAAWEADRSATTDDTDSLQWAVGREEKAAVNAAMKRLNDDFREVVRRRIEQGQTFAEIAEQMDRPLGTVLTWMRRALIELREMTEIRKLGNPDRVKP